MIYDNKRVKIGERTILLRSAREEDAEALLSFMGKRRICSVSRGKLLLPWNRKRILSGKGKSQPGTCCCWPLKMGRILATALSQVLAIFPAMLTGAMWPLRCIRNTAAAELAEK